MKRNLGFWFLFLVMAATIFFACKEQATTTTNPTPTTPAIPDCQKNHTGTLQMENRSSRSLDYTIVIDGISYGRLAVGEKKSYTLSIGSHLLEIRYADHAGDACSASAPTILECQTTSLYCTG
jgi:hypothetical protein